MGWQGRKRGRGRGWGGRGWKGEGVWRGPESDLPRGPHWLSSGLPVMHIMYILPVMLLCYYYQCWYSHFVKVDNYKVIRRFPDSHFPGQTFPGQDVSRTGRFSGTVFAKTLSVISVIVLR